MSEEERRCVEARLARCRELGASMRELADRLDAEVSELSLLIGGQREFGFAGCRCGSCGCKAEGRKEG